MAILIPMYRIPGIMTLGTESGSFENMTIYVDGRQGEQEAKKIQIPILDGRWYDAEFIKYADIWLLKHVMIKDIGVDFFVDGKDLRRCVDVLRYYGYEVKVETAKYYYTKNGNDKPITDEELDAVRKFHTEDCE